MCEVGINMYCVFDDYLVEVVEEYWDGILDFWVGVCVEWVWIEVEYECFVIMIKGEIEDFYILFLVFVNVVKDGEKVLVLVFVEVCVVINGFVMLDIG